MRCSDRDMKHGKKIGFIRSDCANSPCYAAEHSKCANALLFTRDIHDDLPSTNGPVFQGIQKMSGPANEGFGP